LYICTGSSSHWEGYALYSDWIGSSDYDWYWWSGYKLDHPFMELVKEEVRVLNEVQHRAKIIRGIQIGDFYDRLRAKKSI
jgi:hypothetical protein